jgi:hypothetical protein
MQTSFNTLEWIFVKVFILKMSAPNASIMYDIDTQSALGLTASLHFQRLNV